jgi:DNA-binding PadR family transcriptional regulator
MKLLSRQEEIVLLSILRLKDNAYGISIREFISKITGKYWSIGSIYVPLDRLLDKGFVEYYYKNDTNKKGGRKRRFYKLSQDGMKALEDIFQLEKSLWQGLSEFVQDKT